MKQQELLTTHAKLFSQLNDAPERDIQAAILQYLAKCHKVAWAHRMNVGAVKQHNKDGSARWIKFGFRGMPDIMGQLTDGRLLAIEVKKKGGKVSPEQAVFIQAVEAANGVGLIAYSVDDVIERLGKLM